MATTRNLKSRKSASTFNLSAALDAAMPTAPERKGSSGKAQQFPEGEIVTGEIVEILDINTKYGPAAILVLNCEGETQEYWLSHSDVQHKVGTALDKGATFVAIRREPVVRRAVPYTVAISSDGENWEPVTRDYSRA